jgi:hypothetical protein
VKLMKKYVMVLSFVFWLLIGLSTNILANNTLTITNDGHGSTTPSGVVTITYGVSTAISATPNTGYCFSHWVKTAGTGTVTFGNPNSANTTVTVTGGDVTIQANFSVVLKQNIVAIASGSCHSLALKSDGTVWAWGYNLYGQLGNNTTIFYSNIPVQVSILNKVIAIAGGGYYSLALKSDGTIWAWGRNDSGQLGNNTTTDSCVPVQISNLTR